MSQPGNLPTRYVVPFLLFCAAILALTPPAINGALSQAGATEVAAGQSELTVQLAQQLGQVGAIGVAAKDLRTGESYSLGGDQVFDGASTMKLYIVGTLYHMASEEGFNLDAETNIAPSEVQRYGTGGVIATRASRASYRELAKRSLHQSDNTAAFVLAERLGRAKIQSLVDEQGLRDTSIERNTTTPADMVRWLELLNANKLANPADTQSMLADMQHTIWEDRITPGVPPEAIVYHKTGDGLDGGQHDAGIVIYRGRTYAVGIYTRQIGDEAKIAAASRVIFEHFAGREP
jgi:beta-lactamase class A